MTFPSTVPGDIALVLSATRFATKAHDGQVRKYEGGPYIMHPLAVAHMVSTRTLDPHIVAAAVLHDVLEDCPLVSSGDLRAKFGHRVADIVLALTDEPVRPGINRAGRKELDRERIAAAGPEVQLIKAFDMFDNMRSIRDHDPEFYKLYQKEKQAMLAVMEDLDPHVRLLVEDRVQFG